MENQIKIYYLIISILNATLSTRIVISNEMATRATASLWFSDLTAYSFRN